MERVRFHKPGIPTDTDTTMGAVISRAQRDKVLGYIDIAKSEGATLAYGGRQPQDPLLADGFFVEPTLFTGVDQTMRIANEEVFGPVLSVLRWKDEEEMFEQVNSVEYGLSAAIYTRDINDALHAVDRIDAGIVYVNAPTIGAEIPLPFGGTKHTGNGFREAGARGIEQFSQLKTVYVDYSGRLQRAQIDNREDLA